MSGVGEEEFLTKSVTTRLLSYDVTEIIPLSPHISYGERCMIFLPKSFPNVFDKLQNI